MVDGPNVWNIDEQIIFEVFIGDPSTGLGLTAQQSFTDLTIQRDSDSQYWTGSAWSAIRTLLTPNQVDSTNEPGRYNFILPATANNQTDRYVLFVKVDNPPTVEAEGYEVHVSREQDVRVYESEPI